MNEVIFIHCKDNENSRLKFDLVKNVSITNSHIYSLNNKDFLSILETLNDETDLLIKNNKDERSFKLVK